MMKGDKRCYQMLQVSILISCKRRHQISQNVTIKDHVIAIWYIVELYRVHSRLIQNMKYLTKTMEQTMIPTCIPCVGYVPVQL